jgi:hypothetical protein
VKKQKKPSQNQGQRAQLRIDEIRSQIAAMDLICSGTLLERMKKCGKANCRCAVDPESQHGPYYEWSRPENGRLVHKTVSPDQAKYLKVAIANYRKLQTLLVQWKQETMAILLETRKPKS